MIDRRAFYDAPAPQRLWETDRTYQWQLRNFDAKLSRWPRLFGGRYLIVMQPR